MDSWGAAASQNLHVLEYQRHSEAAVGIEAAQSHELVFHHYVWHDVVSHQHPRGTRRYSRSLQELEDFIAELVAGLPPETDLLIFGDHGHLDDGRHLQGLDTPTVVLLRSPNVPGRSLEGRTPITAIRWLSGAVMGLGSGSARVAPEWRSWVSPELGEAFRSSGAPMDAASQHRARPLVVYGATALLALVALGALGWEAGLAVVVWGLLSGLAYPGLHEANLEGTGPRAVIGLTTLVPGLVGLVWLLRKRSAAAGWWAVVVAAVAFGLVLPPLRGVEGLIRNMETVLIPGMVAAALAGAWWTRQDGPTRKRAAWLVALVLVIVVSTYTLSFRANDVRLKSLPMAGMMRRYSAWMLPLGAVAAGALQALVRLRPAPVIAAVVALPLGTVLPVPLQVVAFLVTVGALVGLRGRWRDAVTVPLLILCSAFMYGKAVYVGIVISALVLGTGLVAARAVARARPEPEARSAVSWMGAAALAFGGYAGLAWTLKLSVSGIDFAFILRWIPAGTHETLWWLIFAAVFVKTFVPVFLLHELIQARFPEQARQMVDRALGLASLRVALTLLFTVGWVVRQGPSAGTRRLIRVLQDGYGWAFIAVALLLLLTVHHWRPREAKPPAEPAPRAA